MAAGPFLATREAEHNLLFGISSNVVADEARGVTPEREPYFATASRDSRVVGAALMTPPFQLVLSCVGDPDDDAADAADMADADLAAIAADLAADLAGFPTAPPGVLAPVEVAQAFAAAWCEPRGLVARRTMAERVYRLERVIPPAADPGTVRIAGAADRDLLLDWVDAFLAEALGGPDHAQAVSVVDRALDHGQRTFYLWEVDGEPVSFAAAGGPTPNGIRIGPVYTPPSLRGHGYASAVTAAASQAQLDQGLRFVFLLTNLDNPTSNKIYQAIGYEPVIDLDQLRFEAP